MVAQVPGEKGKQMDTQTRKRLVAHLDGVIVMREREVIFGRSACESLKDARFLLLGEPHPCLPGGILTRFSPPALA
jgi:hypothetical protein